MTKMKIKRREQIPSDKITKLPGGKKTLVIGDYDGSNDIVLRLLSLEPNNSTPEHAHDFPHIWKIEQGQGVLKNDDGEEREVKPNDFVYIANNEKHSLRNTGNTNLEWLCFGTAESEKNVPK